MVKSLGLGLVILIPVECMGASGCNWEWEKIVGDLWDVRAEQHEKIRGIFERIRRAEASGTSIDMVREWDLADALARMPKAVLLTNVLPTKYVVALLAKWEGQRKVGRGLSATEQQELRQWWSRHVSEVTEVVNLNALEKLVGPVELGKLYQGILKDSRWESVERVQQVYGLEVLRPESEWVMGKYGFARLPTSGRVRIAHNRGRQLVRVGSGGTVLELPAIVLMNALANEGAAHTAQMNHILGVTAPLLATFYPEPFLGVLTYLGRHVTDTEKFRHWASRQLSRNERATRNIAPHTDAALHQIVTQVLGQHPGVLDSYSESNGYRCSECHAHITDEHLAYLPTGDLYAHEDCAAEARLKGSPQRVHRVPPELTRPAELVSWLTRYGDEISYELIRQLVVGEVTQFRALRWSSFMAQIVAVLGLTDDISEDALAQVVQDNRVRWYLVLAVLTARGGLSDEDMEVLHRMSGSLDKRGMTKEMDRAHLTFEVDVSVLRGVSAEALKWVQWDLQNLPVQEVFYNETTFAHVMSQLLKMGNPGIQQWVEESLTQAKENPKLAPIVQAIRDIQLIQRGTGESFGDAQRRWFGAERYSAQVKADMLLTEVGVKGSRFQAFLDKIPPAQHEAVRAGLDERTNLRVFLDLAKKQNLEKFLLENARAESFVYIRIEDRGRTYYIHSTTTTQLQYALVLGSNPSHFTQRGVEITVNGAKLRVDTNRPVEQVSWNDMGTYITELNKFDSQHHVRRPTEAEWDRVARAGTSTDYSFGGDPDQLVHYGVFGRSEEEGTAPVASLRANPFGLYDVHGNVSEWMEDVDGQFRVRRGGGWGNNARYCRLANRFSNNPEYYRSRDLGFRLVGSSILSP